MAGRATLWLSLLAFALAAMPCAGLAQDANDASEKEIEHYRQMLKDDPWSNPAMLDVDRGEALWKNAARPEERLARRLRPRQGSRRGEGRFRRAAALLRRCRPRHGLGSAHRLVHGEAAGFRQGSAAEEALSRRRQSDQGPGRARHLRGVPVEWPEVRAEARPSQGTGSIGAGRGAVLPPRRSDGLRLRHLPRRPGQAHSPAGSALSFEAGRGAQGRGRMAGLPRVARATS